MERPFEIRGVNMLRVMKVRERREDGQRGAEPSLVLWAEPALSCGREPGSLSCGDVCLSHRLASFPLLALSCEKMKKQ